MVKQGKEVPLLHGIPISLSDPILVRDTSSNWCRCADLYPLQEQDSVLVQVIRRAGAIPFVKTTTSINSASDT